MKKKTSRTAASARLVSPSRSFRLEPSALKSAIRCKALRGEGQPYGVARLRSDLVVVHMLVPEAERSIKRALGLREFIARESRRAGALRQPNRRECLPDIRVNLAFCFLGVRQ